MAKIVITQDNYGVVGLSYEDITSHADALLILCTAIHATHTAHDEAVKAGAAGVGHQRLFKRMEALQRGEQELPPERRN